MIDLPFPLRSKVYHAETFQGRVTDVVEYEVTGYMILGLGEFIMVQDAETRVGATFHVSEVYAIK